ncbi:MAG: hypothetical protein DWQ10_09390 [Calditrichaeota bacterium]|nr:MAG: hypothetical protein DWQ10_09390 [Calditrichota bacterium]
MQTRAVFRKFSCILVLFLMSLFFIQHVNASSAASGTFEITQPDGARFDAIQKGDEWQNWV